MTLDFWPYKKYAISFLALILVFYILFQSRNFLMGPRLAFLSPLDGETLNGPIIEVAGTAKNVSFLSLNDKQIFINDDGEFRERLLPSPGLVILTLKGKDRFGREKKLQEKIIVLGDKTPQTVATTTSATTTPAN